MDSARLNAELDSLSDGLQIRNDEESVQKLRDLLQCPVCLELPLPPIYLCKRGHIVCNACQDKTYYCPLCREEYSNTRSFVAEGLIENFTMKCKFRGQGCTQVLQGSDMANHMKTCDFRPARCIHCQGDRVPYGEFFDHLVTKHKIEGVEMKDGDGNGSVKYNIPLSQVLEAAIEKYCWVPTFFKCLGETFLFHVHLAGGNVCGWICLLGPESDCTKFEAIIELQGEKFTLQWKGQANNFREDPLNTICKVGGGLILPYEVVRSSSVVNRTEQVIEWSYNVRIREKRVPPEPVKSEEPQTGSQQVEEPTSSTPAENAEERQRQETEAPSKSLNLPSRGLDTLDHGLHLPGDELERFSLAEFGNVNASRPLYMRSAQFVRDERFRLQIYNDSDLDLAEF